MTFLLVLPLTQVIVTAFTAGLEEALGVGVGAVVGLATWTNGQVNTMKNDANNKIQFIRIKQE